MPSIIDDDVIIGFKSVISEGVVIQRGAFVGPNSVVPPGRTILAGERWEGSPLREITTGQNVREI